MNKTFIILFNTSSDLVFAWCFENNMGIQIDFIWLLEYGKVVTEKYLMKLFIIKETVLISPCQKTFEFKIYDLLL